MKPHLRIKLKQGTVLPQLPHWAAVVEGLRPRSPRFIPEVDGLLAKYGLSFIATQEYQSANRGWTDDEVTAGLNRVYRLILANNQRLPTSLIGEISILPSVEQATTGVIGEVELPSPQAQALAYRTGRRERDAIYLDEAQRFHMGDPQVTVAVLDTGIHLDHPELQHALLPGYDFVDILGGAKDFIGDFTGADALADDEVGHGTHVAGIIAGRGISMPRGVVPRCKILPVRVLGAMKRGEKVFGAGLVENINNGMKWAIDQGADVINMSLGVKHQAGGLPHKEVVDYAKRKGVTIVAAAGNDGMEQLYYPGAYDSVITVGACDRQGEVANFSTYGKQVTLVAPGESIYSTHLNNRYSFSTGTSHAAPFVAGAVALMKSYAKDKGRRLSDAQIKHILKHTCDKLDRKFKSKRAGFGKLNMVDAMRLLDAKLIAGAH